MCYRGYLAGTDLTAGTIGLTSLPEPGRYVRPLLAVAPGCWSGRRAEGGVWQGDAAAAAAFLADPRAFALLAAADEPLPPELLPVLAPAARRTALPLLHRLLSRAHLVVLPEPAHHGFDYTLVASLPLRERLAAALRSELDEGLRCFVLPFAAARSEEKFYFELYDLERYAAYELT